MKLELIDLEKAQTMDSQFLLRSIFGTDFDELDRQLDMCKAHGRSSVLNRKSIQHFVEYDLRNLLDAALALEISFDFLYVRGDDGAFDNEPDTVQLHLDGRTLRVLRAPCLDVEGRWYIGFKNLSKKNKNRLDVFGWFEHSQHQDLWVAP